MWAKDASDPRDERKQWAKAIAEGRCESPQKKREKWMKTLGDMETVWDSSADLNRVDLFYVAVMLFHWRSWYRKWGSCVGVMLWDSSTSVRDKKQRKGKITGFLWKEILGIWRNWESRMCALALPHGCALPLPRPLSPQGCLASMCMMVSLLRGIAFTSSGSPGVWDGLFGENEHICPSWVGLSPTFLSLKNANPPFAP